MKPTLLLTTMGLSLLCVLQAPPTTVADTNSVIRRADKPDCFQIRDNDKAMEQAVQRARETLPRFITALRSPKANQSRFAIKKAFIEGDKVEHLWVHDVRFDGRRFHGTIDNEPVDLKATHLGDEVTFSPAEISDWMYVQENRLIGGYTVRCLCRELSPAQRKQFEEELHCRVD